MAKRSSLSESSTAGGNASDRSIAPGRRSRTQDLARPRIQRAALGDAAVAPNAGAAVDQAAGSTGAPLRADVRTRFESSLGADLSAVRVHTGAASEDAAASIGARAYATGNDIHFGRGQYQPGDPFGLHLLAHEVAHTQQQAGGAPQTQAKLEVSSPGDAAEHDADRAADAMIAGLSFAVTRAPAALARTPADDAAPASVRSPAALDQIRIDVLKKQLVEDQSDSRDVAVNLGAAVNAIDEKLKTASPAEKIDLEAKKKAMQPKLDAARDKLYTATEDLRILAGGPDITTKDVNDVLARRNVTAAAPDGTPEPEERDAKTKVDDKGISRESSQTVNARTSDGSSVTKTDSSWTEIGLTGGAHTTTSSEKAIKGDTTESTSTSTKREVDLKEGSYSSSRTTSSSTTNADGTSQGTTEVKSGKLSSEGASLSQSTTAEKNGNKSTTSTGGGVVRGDGQLGVTSNMGTKVENKDGSGSSTSMSKTAGVIDGKEGIGAFGKGDASAAKTFKNGADLHGKVTAGGNVTVKVEKIEDTDPAQYQIVVAISLSASLSAGGGLKKGDSTAGLDAKASGSITATFGQKLDESAAKAYLDAVDAAAKGDGAGAPEMQIIATGVHEGWPAARDLYDRMRANGHGPANELKDGQSISVDAKAEGGVDASAGTKNGSTGGGLSGGYKQSHEISGGIRREGDDMIGTFLITDGSTLSGGAKINEGAAGMSFDGKKTAAGGKGYTFTVPASRTDLVHEMETFTTIAQLDAFAAAHPKMVGSRTTTKSEGESANIGANVGPGSITMDVGHGMDESHTEKLDKDGNVDEKDDKFDGRTNVGGGMSLGPLSHTDEHDEHIATDVKTVKGKDGNWKQTATGDLSTTDSSSSTDLLKSADELKQTVKGDPLGAATGKTALAKTSEKKAIAGVLLGDGDFDRIMALAKEDPPHTWVNAGVSDRDAWNKCRRAVAAAGDDKVKVAKALAEYGEADTGGGATISELIGANKGEGGDRYEFPDGLGDLKAEYLALVINDPTGDVAAKEKSDPAGAADAATKIADRCDTFVNRMNQVQSGPEKPFKNVEVFAEMNRRAGERGTAMRNKALELRSAASGKPVSADALDRAKAATEWNSLLDQCRANTSDQESYFAKIHEAHESLMGNHDEASAVTEVNQLKKLIPPWQKQYDRMVELNQMYGFGEGVQWRDWKPDTTRLAIAYQGQDPSSDEAMDKSNQKDQDHQEAEQQDADADKAWHQRNDAILPGMTPDGHGGYSGELQGSMLADYIAKTKARIASEMPTWEANVAAARAEAQQAMGRCNLLTSGGTWDKVAKSAMGPYNEGYKSFSEADGMWKEAKMFAQLQTKQVESFFDRASGARSSFHDARDAFKQGDEAQGAAG